MQVVIVNLLFHTFSNGQKGPELSPDEQFDYFHAKECLTVPEKKIVTTVLKSDASFFIVFLFAFLISTLFFFLYKLLHYGSSRN